MEIATRFYNAGTDTLINAIRELPENAMLRCLSDTARHTSLVHELTDPATSSPQAVEAIETRFPAPGLAQLGFEGDLVQPRGLLADFCPDAGF
jgi:hypothetical protein